MAQTTYNTAPGGGNPFFAGLEELFNAPASFARDVASSTGIVDQSTYIPPTKTLSSGQTVVEPGGGSSFVAGLEEGAQNPTGFAADLGLPNLPDLPGQGTITIWLVLAVVGVLGIAYISHKAL